MTFGDKVVVMSDGKVHQTGRPETIYSRPADTFVATFIGLPEMNLYSGKVMRREGRHYFQGQGLCLDLEGLPLEFDEVEVEVGIRPEDVKIRKDSIRAIQARVEIINDVGSEKYIHASLGQARLILRVPKDKTFQPNEIIFLDIDPDRVHIFHKGLRI